MKTKRERISVLSRRNRGRVAIPSFLDNLAEAIGEPIGTSALLSLPETDVLTESFRAAYQDAARGSICYRRFFHSEDKQLVIRRAMCLSDKLANEQSFFLTKLSETCGAVGVNISTLLKRADRILNLDGDSICAIAKDQSQGLLVDYNQGGGEQTYEVTVWGSRWSALALACDISDAK